MHHVHHYSANCALDACLWLPHVDDGSENRRKFACTSSQVQRGIRGRVAAETLSWRAGKAVRVVVRDAGKAKAFAALGAEVVVAELFDEAGADPGACLGPRACSLLSPPDSRGHRLPLAARRRSAASLARAAKAANVRHVVFLSSIGCATCERHRPDPHHPRARASKRAARNWATGDVRATGATSSRTGRRGLQPARQDGVCPAFCAANRAIRDGNQPRRNIGSAVARALLDGPRGPA